MEKTLFRAKRANNGSWIYGFYIRHETRQICIIGGDKLQDDEIIHLIAEDGFADWNMPRTLELRKVLPQTVGQFTGATCGDKNRIFKDDILYFEFEGQSHEGIVVWDQSKLQWAIKSKDDNLIPLADAINECSIVLGNIHEGRHNESL